MSKDHEYGRPIWYILRNGRVLFWDGLVRVNRDLWDGIVVELLNWDQEVVDEVRQGRVDCLSPLTPQHSAPHVPVPMFGRN